VFAVGVIVTVTPAYIALLGASAPFKAESDLEKN
jgi:hypothetical protein